MPLLSSLEHFKSFDVSYALTALNTIELMIGYGGLRCIIFAYHENMNGSIYHTKAPSESLVAWH